jgi:hypothetical protein
MIKTKEMGCVKNTIGLPWEITRACLIVRSNIGDSINEIIKGAVGYSYFCMMYPIRPKNNIKMISKILLEVA